MKRSLQIGIIAIVAMYVCLTGCATHITKPTSDPVPSKVKFGTFTNVEMKAVKANEKLALSSANQRAIRKIDELLFRDMKYSFNGLKRIDEDEDFSKNSESTLQITPTVKEVKFVSKGSRIMWGAMSGSSAILMQVSYRDGSSGKIIAEPEFYRSSDAWTGGMSMGSADNMMLEYIVKDIVNYSSGNR